MEMIKVGVVGATGYAGAELCRLIIGHSKVKLEAISSVSFTGKRLSEVYPEYQGLCDLVCETQEETLNRCEVIFAALPHGLSQELAQRCDESGKVFIDLGADFRLKSESEYETWYGGRFMNMALHEKAVYGLPELFREEIKGCKLVANPGCYTTAVPLALAPAIRAGLISPHGIIADCKSGVTGAGRKATESSHYPQLNDNFYAYKLAAHRHTPEIEQTLSVLAGETVAVTFAPHLLPINRGILATCYARLSDGVNAEKIMEAYTQTYAEETFIRLMPYGKTPTVRQVRYSNYCDIGIVVDEHTKTLIAVSAIDNMMKGAAGQAVQNMNLCLGFCEQEGLTAVAPAF